MFKLSRRSEYALIAIQHIARNEAAAVAANENPPTCRVSVAAMADSEQIPRQLLAKVMQQLKRAGIARSVKGVGGGYELAKPLDEVMFVEVIAPFEDQVGLVDCAADEATPCTRGDCCNLQSPIKNLNSFLIGQLRNVTMADFLAMTLPRATLLSRGRFRARATTNEGQLATTP